MHCRQDHYSCSDLSPSNVQPAKMETKAKYKTSKRFPGSAEADEKKKMVCGLDRDFTAIY